ncbi:MAG: TonB-dependent receptor family protein [Flavisolibacter sp.]|nr:TonB-dependent receptor family protein [Flavisolibacter sp.]
MSDIERISTGQLITRNENNVRNRGSNVNLTQGLSLKNKMDSLGSEWSTDLSYTYAPNNVDQFFTTSFLVPAGATVDGTGDLNNRLQFFTAQTNLQKKLRSKITLETGVKTSNVWFTNRTDYFRHLGTTRIKDEFRTGAYRYNENIHSAYLQASKAFGSITLKMGTRMENTNMQGHQQVPRDTSFSLHRTDFFPYVYLSRNLMKIAGYNLRGYLVYRRTITRPAYEFLNPSIRFVDPYLIEIGNPTLRPQFNQNFEANVSVDEHPIFALGVNNTKDIFNQVIYQADSSRSQAYRTYDNLGSNKEVYLRALGALPPGRRYFFVAGVQYNHNFYEGLYENKPLQFKRGSFTFFTYHTLKITPTTQIVLNGFARFRGQLQFYELSSFGALNLSLNQQLLKKKLTVGIAVSDVFRTNYNEFVLQQGTVYASGIRQGDTRRFGLTLRYNFGFRRKEESNILNVESPEKTAQ